jgi:hypothetical protein
MGDVAYDRGGFYDRGYAPWMSDVMIRRLAMAEADDLREQHQLNREREQFAADCAARSASAAVFMAEQRGEWVSPLEAARGLVGRTPSEAMAYASAQMDLEDAQHRARLRRAEGLSEAEVTLALSSP